MLIENYLQHKYKRAIDIFFRKEQLQSTQRLIINVNRNMQEGLSPNSVIHNQLLYTNNLQEDDWG